MYYSLTPRVHVKEPYKVLRYIRYPSKPDQNGTSSLTRRRFHCISVFPKLVPTVFMIFYQAWCLVLYNILDALLIRSLSLLLRRPVRFLSPYFGSWGTWESQNSKRKTLRYNSITLIKVFVVVVVVVVLTCHVQYKVKLTSLDDLIQPFKCEGI